MKIKKHSESHLVELSDGSKWQVYPGDVDATLNWQPEVDLKLVRIADEVSFHALVSGSDNSSVRVLPEGENWPVNRVRGMLGRALTGREQVGGLARRERPVRTTP